jgi:hypothetical protein
MSKAKRSIHYITTIPNTVEGLKILADLRDAMRRKGLGTRVYGRCRHKRKVFSKNSRGYQYCNNFANDISLRSAEATDCYEWAVYFRPKRERKASSLDKCLFTPEQLEDAFGLKFTPEEIEEATSNLKQLLAIEQI